ncbi:MAG TPA: DUF2092 domain-containing protein [Solirubrobacteraceae bacterium]|nr:DUF2092 domain-containing protein [Solirubrobacteraceae bacterium]
MRRLRTLSTRRLVLIGAAVVAVAAGGGIAQAQLSGGAPEPQPKALDQAVYDALRAPEVQGVTARVKFTNNLIPAGSLPNGSASPLLTGAEGRLWLTQDGRFRIELQSDSGDAQIVSDGKTVQAYDADSNVVYRAALPEPKAEDRAKAQREERRGPPSLADIRKGLEDLAERWSLSGADPTSTGGRPSYTVRISPKDDGGLLGAAELAWDAERGAPLRAAVYADDQQDPVLELEATDIAYEQVPASDVTARFPENAEVVEVAPPAGGDEAGRDKRHAKVEGVDEVQQRLDFQLAAPGELAGLPRQEVRLVEARKGQSAVVTYGEGLGAIVVLQGKAGRDDARGGPGDRADQLQLPKVNVDGATGTELATSLGTVVTFERDGVSYTVVGSVPPQAAEQAARDLG